MGKLSMCKQGDIVRVQSISGSGAFKKRLLEMGFLKGVSLRIVKYAPLKDPMELVIKDFSVSLRVCEANRIDVSPV